jgi:hypothetical protein
MVGMPGFVANNRAAALVNKMVLYYLHERMWNRIPPPRITRFVIMMKWRLNGCVVADLPFSEGVL